MRNASCRKSVVLKQDVIPGVVCVPGLRMTFGAYRGGLDTEMVIEHGETPFYLYSCTLWLRYRRWMAFDKKQRIWLWWRRSLSKERSVGTK